MYRDPATRSTTEKVKNVSAAMLDDFDVDKKLFILKHADKPLVTCLSADVVSLGNGPLSQVEVQINHIELFGSGQTAYYGMLVFVILLAIVLCIQILLKFKALFDSWKAFRRLPQWSSLAFPSIYLSMYLGMSSCTQCTLLLTCWSGSRTFISMVYVYGSSHATAGELVEA